MKKKYEYEFLPSALEVEETPPSPFGKLIIWAIFTIIIAAVVWSIFAKTDKVAAARGKIIPVGRVRVVEPLEEGIVKSIYIKEGVKVKKGQILLELDSTIKTANIDELEEQLDILKLEHFMASLNLENKYFKDVTSIYANSNFKKLSRNRIYFITKLQQSKISEYREKLFAQKHIITEAESEKNIAKNQLKKLQVKNRMLGNEEEMFKKLAEKGSISKREWWLKKNEEDVLAEEISIQKVEIEKASYKIDGAKHTLNIIGKKWETNNLSHIVEIEKKTKSIEAELIKAKRMFELKKLYSPIDGTVNQLEVTTIGEVVNPGEAIITIVPSDMPILAEAKALNKDIGFIRIGQKAELKLDTFPFHKYGILEGKVTNISPDAIMDQQTGQLLYNIQVKPSRNKLFIAGREINITPGMSLTVEIKIGKRRIIEFFMDPISRFKDEGFKLR